MIQDNGIMKYSFNSTIQIFKCAIIGFLNYISMIGIFTFKSVLSLTDKYKLYSL